MPRGHHGNHARSNRQHRWSEQKIIASNGYVKIRVGKDHPLADPNGYAYEHLVVWVAAGLQRPPRGFLIHHRNDVKTDNRFDNLELLSRGEHNRLHNQQKGRDPLTGRIGKRLDGRIHDAMPGA